jgi:hypothetical protein
MVSPVSPLGGAPSSSSANWLDGNPRGERQESETSAGDGKQGRVWHGQQFRQIGQDDRCQQQHQNPFEHRHLHVLAKFWRALR